MNSSVIENELHDAIHQLPLQQQQQVLGYIRSLSAVSLQGVPGASLLRFGGTIALDDLALMQQAITVGCETVDEDEW